MLSVGLIIGFVIGFLVGAFVMSEIERKDTPPNFDNE